MRPDSVATAALTALALAGCGRAAITPLGHQSRVHSVVMESLAADWSDLSVPIFLSDTTIRLAGMYLSDTPTLSQGAGIESMLDDPTKIPADWITAVRELIALDSLPAHNVSGHRRAQLVRDVPRDTTLSEPYPPLCVVQQVSRVGFDASMTVAAVYATERCTDVGHGELVLLRRAQNGWTIAHVLNLWSAG